jgi:probable addiction module antidote protein
LARLRSATLGNFGDCDSVGEGVSEMRIHTGPGYRVYFTRTEAPLYFLLTGGEVHAKARHRPRKEHGPRVEGVENMKTTYAPFDVAEYLDNDEAVAEYLTATLEDGNPDVFLAALGDVAKARGMAQIAEAAGLGRESLYKALSEGAHPRYETINAVLHALGVKFTVVSSHPAPR